MYRKGDKIKLLARGLLDLKKKIRIKYRFSTSPHFSSTLPPLSLPLDDVVRQIIHANDERNAISWSAQSLAELSIELSMGTCTAEVITYLCTH